MLCRNLFIFLVLAAPVLCATLPGTSSEDDDAEASVKNSEDEPPEARSHPGLLQSFLYGSNIPGVLNNLETGKPSVDEVDSSSEKEPSEEPGFVANEAEKETSSEEIPKPRTLAHTVHPFDIYSDPYSQQPGPLEASAWGDQEYYGYPSQSRHFYDDPYWLLDEGQYGYDQHWPSFESGYDPLGGRYFGSPYSRPYGGSSSGYCPPCYTKYDHHDEDKDEDEYYTEEDEEYEGDHTKYYKEDYSDSDYKDEYRPSDEYRPEKPSFYFDPTVRYEYDLLRGKSGESDEESVDSPASHRSKRSTEPFDWYSVGAPSKFLERHNVGFRIKNHLREQLRREYFPLHYGHIRLGSGGHGKKHRKFGDYTDFDVHSDATAFSETPKGPILGKNWIKHGFPVYGYNLYKLKKPIYGKLVTKRFVTTLKDDGPYVQVKPGVYRIEMILDDSRSLVIESLGNHKRYFLKGVLHDGKTLKKFQALAAWKDKGAKFFRVDMTKGDYAGIAYIVKSSPLGGANPEVQRHYGVKRHKFPHLKLDPTLLLPSQAQYKIKLRHKPNHHRRGYKFPQPMGPIADPPFTDPIPEEPMGGPGSSPGMAPDVPPVMVPDTPPTGPGSSPSSPMGPGGTPSSPANPGSPGGPPRTPPNAAGRSASADLLNSPPTLFNY